MSFVKPSGKCKQGKVKYPTEEAALDFLARSRRWAADMNAYRCGPCQSWHVGHIQRQKARVGVAR